MAKIGCVADFVEECLGGAWEELGEVNPMLSYLNTYRAGIWKDYFPSFLRAVKIYLENDSLSAAKLPEGFVRLMEANDFFWKNYRGRFSKYVRDFFLEGYLDRHGEVVELPRIYWWDKSLTLEMYVAAANRYLNFANRIIKERADRIICSLLGHVERQVQSPKIVVM